MTKAWVGAEARAAAEGGTETVSNCRVHRQARPPPQEVRDGASGSGSRSVGGRDGGQVGGGKMAGGVGGGRGAGHVARAGCRRSTCRHVTRGADEMGVGVGRV